MTSLSIADITSGISADIAAAQDSAPAAAPAADPSNPFGQPQSLVEAVTGQAGGSVPAPAETAPAPAPVAAPAQVTPDTQIPELAPINVAPQAPAPQAFDFQRYLAERDRRESANHQRFIQTLESLKPAPPPVDQDALLMQELPPEYRTPENLAQYKIMKAAASREVQAIKDQLAQRDEQETFTRAIQGQEADISRRVMPALQNYGFDFNVPGGDKAAALVRTMGLSLAAARGGNPSDHLPEIAQALDVLTRGRLAHQVAKNRTIQQNRQSVAVAPPTVGAPGAPATQAGGPAKVYSEQEALRMGYKSLREGYYDNFSKAQKS